MIRWIVVQVLYCEPLSAAGPFDTKEQAEAWLTQHKATQPETDKVAWWIIELATDVAAA